ncbi:MAG: 3-deoxy-manno-octulosonate cytidylyltransferase [Rhodanobacteraceae bacterium]
MTRLPPFTVAIPARYAATRLPGKPLRLLAGEPLIRHVARRALVSGARSVVIASDHQDVLDAVADLDVQVCMTSSDCRSGSDRLAECARHCGWTDDEPVVNLQGDEPFAPVSGIHAAVVALVEDDAPMATLATALHSRDELFDVNCVKLVRDRRGRALYFSRAPVPWARDALAAHPAELPTGVPLLRHIGLYAYRAGFLHTFSQLEPGALETAESLEQLRALEHGYPIAVHLVSEPFPPGIDSAADLARAERHLQGANNE